MDHLTDHLPNLTETIAGLAAGFAAVQTWFKEQTVYVKIAVLVGAFVVVAGVLSLIT